MYCIFVPYNCDYLSIWHEPTGSCNGDRMGLLGLALGTETLNAVQANFSLESAKG